MHIFTSKIHDNIFAIGINNLQLCRLSLALLLLKYHFHDNFQFHNISALTDR